MSVLMMLAGLVILFPMRKQLVGIMSNDGKTVAAAVKYIDSGSYNTARSCTVSELYRSVQRLRKYSAYPFYVICMAVGVKNPNAACGGQDVY